MMRVGEQSPFISLRAIASVATGVRGLVHVWGRNDMSTAQQLGISWTVKDPDGVVIEQYSAWEAWPHTGAGGEHEFIGGRFDINKAGNWTITIQLLMNPDNLVVVDSYDGLLCVVTEVAPPVYAGTLTRKELEYDSVRGDIPVY